jgi:hypothetical protein
MVNRRAQSGIEFLAVTGIGMLLLLSVSFFLLSDSKSSQDRAQLQQTQSIANDLLAQARIVQAQGRNSWVTVEAQVPRGVSAVYTVESDTLVFDINTVNGVVSQPIFSTIPINGTHLVGDRMYLYDPATTNLGGGLQRFTVFSNGTVVVLSMR